MKKIKKVSVDSEPYLAQLPNFDQTLKQLYILGQLPQKRQFSVSIVGSRAITPYGREITNRLSSGLAKRGAIIISGLALGADAAAHQGALQVNGKTIAILANGLDRIYPASNRQLGEQILSSGGAIISEYPPGTDPRKENFIARNRIVSALADVLIIIEAASKSGTLHTAAFALTQGKPVYAVPGNITSPTSSGCNRLIAEGAIPIVDIDETIDQLMPGTKQAKLLLGDNKEEQIILDLLQNGVRDGDELLQKSGLEPQVYHQTLTMLELSGQIKPLGSNRWSL